jgi:hypothetical protein
VDANHILIVNFFEKEVNGLIKKIHEKQPTKKRSNVSNNARFNFFAIKVPFKRNDE